MALLINLRHLEAHAVRLQGLLSVAELDIDSVDEVIQLQQPLEYDLEVENLEGGLLVQGRLHMSLNCECVRCLKKFEYHLDLADWKAHMPLEGEDSVAVINDCVDLTAAVREDILLAFPQHPLCDPGCRGLPRMRAGQTAGESKPGKNDAEASVWVELNKLKF
jgi:uncharacterized metal-binding protein YceD (DUF177 family)